MIWQKSMTTKHFESNQRNVLKAMDEPFHKNITIRRNKCLIWAINGSIKCNYHFALLNLKK